MLFRSPENKFSAARLRILGRAHSSPAQPAKETLTLGFLYKYRPLPLHLVIFHSHPYSFSAATPFLSSPSRLFRGVFFPSAQGTPTTPFIPAPHPWRLGSSFLGAPFLLPVAGPGTRGFPLGSPPGRHFLQAQAPRTSREPLCSYSSMAPPTARALLWSSAREEIPPMSHPRSAPAFPLSCGQPWRLGSPASPSSLLLPMARCSSAELIPSSISLMRPLLLSTEPPFSTASSSREQPLLFPSSRSSYSHGACPCSCLHGRQCR